MVEFQRRGAVHFHPLFLFNGPGLPMIFRRFCAVTPNCWPT